MINNFLNFINTPLTESSIGYSGKVDLSIEGMRSQHFSYGVFAFLMVGIAVFAGIVIAMIKEQASAGKMRIGEKIMFGAIIMGIIVAIFFAATQMVNGFLF